MKDSEVIKIHEEALKLIKANEEALFFKIGVEEIYKSLPKGVKASAPYRKIGEETYNKAIKKIRKILCVRGKVNPKFALDGFSGIIIGALIGDFTSGTAAAILGLIYKKGIDKICELPIAVNKRTKKKNKR